MTELAVHWTDRPPCDRGRMADDRFTYDLASVTCLACLRHAGRKLLSEDWVSWVEAPKLLGPGQGPAVVYRLVKAGKVRTIALPRGQWDRQSGGRHRHLYNRADILAAAREAAA